MLSRNRSHNRKSFFKYMPAPTARIVLANRTLRWSSPVLFNDPFDVPRELIFGVTPNDIVKELADRMAYLIEHPPEDTSDLEPNVQLVVETIKRGISAELKEELLHGIAESAASTQPTSKSMDALRAMWRDLVPDFRILSLTESPAHVAMWCHYADRYRGAVLEFRCVDDLDSAWLMAQPVMYPVDKPDVYTANGWARMLTLRAEIALRKMLNVAALTKSEDWSYEREWRVFSFKRPTDTGPFTDYKFNPEELGDIILGPMVSSSDASDLMVLAQQYPNSRVFKTEIGLNRELHFSTGV